MAKSKTKFPLEFLFQQRDPTALPIDNILEREENEYRHKTTEELLAMLKTEANSLYHSTIDRYRKLQKQFDPEFYPKITEVELGKLQSDEDINRELDVGHATKIFANYDEEMFQPIYCIKTPLKDEWTIVNGQHTATSTSAIVEGGFMKGYKPQNWKKFKVLVIYIETHNRAKAREAFALLNGEFSKGIDTFDIWKQHYLSVRLDKSGNPKYLLTSQIIDVMKEFYCVPLPEGHDDVGQPGAATHLSGIELLVGEDGDLTKLRFVFSNRNNYWNHMAVDAAEFGFYGNLFDYARLHNLNLNSKEGEQFMLDIHAVVQKVFRNMGKLKTTAQAAFKKYRFEQFTDQNATGGAFNRDLYFAYKVYRVLGGTFELPGFDELYTNKGVDSIQYMDKEIDFINKYLPIDKHIVKKSIQLPKKK